MVKVTFSCLVAFQNDRKKSIKTYFLEKKKQPQSWRNIEEKLKI